MLRRLMMAGAAGGGGGGADPYWANVVSLLHFDGENGSTSLTDETGRAWSAVNSAIIDASQSKFGGSSCLFNANNSYAQAAASNDFGFGTGDFTVETHARWLSGAGRGYIFDTGTNKSALIITASSGLVEVYGPSSWVINAGSTPFVTGQWYHLALVRNGNAWTFYRDGVAYVSNASDTRSWGDSTVAFRIGNSGAAETRHIGNLDEFRITKGVARYTANFTPPTAPFPNS